MFPTLPEGRAKMLLESQSSVPLLCLSLNDGGVDVSLSFWRIGTDGAGPECLCDCVSTPVEDLDVSLPRQEQDLCFAVFSNLLPLMSVPCGSLDVQGQSKGELLPRIIMSFSLSDESCNWKTWPEFVRNSRVFPKSEVTTHFSPLFRKGYQMPVDEFLCVPPSAELWFEWKLEMLRDRECNQESAEWLPSPVACSPLEQG